MQNKFELFNALFPELQIDTAQNLSNRDLVNLAQASKYHFALFKPMIGLRYVVCGNHEAVKAMLKHDMNLIFKRGKVTDCSGRKFESVSSFEYALWALDKHMWATMIACIPSNEEGKKVFAQLVVQYNKVNTDGVTYRLDGKTITEKHFDFENTIIKELQTQVNSIIEPGIKNWDSIDNQWREGVGGAQKRLPMHVVFEYCSTLPFYPVSKFISPPKASTKFYNWTTNKSEEWFHGDSRLGSEFAIYKGLCGHWHGGTSGYHRRECVASARGRTYDLYSMKALCKVRTQDLINLKSQIENQANLDNHYQVVFPM